MSRAERLSTHVAAAGPVVWGASDCCANAATWIAAETGRAFDIPVYASREEAYDLVRAAGGLVKLLSPIAAAAGLLRTAAPEVGDVGVVHLSRYDVVMIFAGNGLALWRRDEGGYMPFYPRKKFIMRAWHIP